jgi:8-oxo-dGTP pyrophosphatase MutT (NUDIX family)
MTSLTKNTTTTTKAYHATSPEASACILSSSFLLPTKKQGKRRGLKMGAAIYFGKDQKYCKQEARGTLIDQLRQSNRKRKKEDRLNEKDVQTICLEAVIDLSACLDLTEFNYEEGANGKLPWFVPMFDSEDVSQVILPNGKRRDKNIILNRKKWDKYTESMDVDYLMQGGWDTIKFRINDTIEYAVYNLDRIVNVQLVQSVPLTTPPDPRFNTTDDELPPYCCVILHEETTDVLLMEDRIEATVASGLLCCIGGKRELNESALHCITREYKEELGIELENALTRVVDLYVDGTLIAYFYHCAAPSRDASLIFESGRNVVWLTRSDVENNARISPWHQCVLKAWRNGEVRADFVTV